MSLMRRRLIAIVAAALALIILGFALAGVLKYVAIVEIKDVDDTKYYARKVNGEYKLFAKGSKTPLEKDEEYDYYITAKNSLVDIDESTGELVELIPLDSVYRPSETETLGNNNRVLIFPQIKKANIMSIEVNNSTGSYTFERMNEKGERDPKGDFVIKNSPLTAYNQEFFAQMYVGAGYTISLMRLDDPMLGADGKVDLNEYGLTSAIRERKVIDEETGNVTDEIETYEYKPASYIIEDISGNKHKIIIGDKLVTDGGYYVQYVNATTGEARQAVYILASSIGETMLAPIEDYVAPSIGYPLSMATYYDVENFTVKQRIANEAEGALSGYKNIYDDVISFTYNGDPNRIYTSAAITPYEFNYDLVGYNASDSAISTSLYNLYSPSIVGTAKHAPTPAELVEYGLMTEQLDTDGNVVKNEDGEIQYVPFSKYSIDYYYDILNEEKNAVESTIRQVMFISDKDFEKTGNYYVYTLLYNVELDKDMNKTGKEALVVGAYNYITEVEGHMFDFLSWDEYRWVNPSYVNQNIAYLGQIKIDSPNYSAVFNVDNSKSPQYEETAVSSEHLYAVGSDSLGNSIETFGCLKVVTSQYTFVITTANIRVYNKKGETVKFIGENTYYTNNAIGDEVYCINEELKSGKATAIYLNGEKLKNGKNAQVTVSANNVTVHFSNGSKTTYLRYSNEIFRKYYMTFLYAKLIGAYELSEEEKATVLTDENLLMTVEITNRETIALDSKETVDVYKFYKLTSRKAYITVNGNGGFYVYTNRVEKFITDAQKVFALEDIEPTDKK